MTSTEINRAQRFVNAHPPAYCEPFRSLNAVFIRLEVVDNAGHLLHEWHSCHSMAEVKVLLGY